MSSYTAFYLIFFTLAALALVELMGKPIQRANVINLAAVLGLLVLIGFRGDFDSDYEAYVGIYEQVRFDDWETFQASFRLNVEVLYVLIMMLLKLFTLPAQSIFVTSAFLSLWPNWRYCLRRIAYPTLALLGLLAHSLLYREFTTVRHGIAGALCVAGLFLLSSGSTRKAFWLMLIACCFHSASAFVMFFSWLFLRLERRRFLQVCTAIGVFLFVVGIQQLLDATSAFITLPSSITVYSKSEYDFNLGLLNPTLIKQAFSMLFFLACVRRYKIEDKRYLDLLCFYYVSIIWLFGANEFAMFAGRLASFFGVLDAYLFAMTLGYVRARRWRLVMFAALVLVYFAQFYLNLEFKELFHDDYFFA